MNSKMFSNVNVYKPKQRNSSILENLSHVDLTMSPEDILTVDFISKLDTATISSVYDEVSYRVGSIDPNLLVPYTDRLVRFRLDDYLVNMISFLTDQNIIKLKNIFLGTQPNKVLEENVLNIIEEECRLRGLTSYTKIRFFSSSNSIKPSSPFSNCIMKQLYLSTFQFDCSSGCKLDINLIIQLLSNLEPYERKCLQDNIYQLLTLIVLSFNRQSINKYKMGDGYALPDYIKLINAIMEYVLPGNDSSLLKVLQYSSEIVSNRLETLPNHEATVSRMKYELLHAIRNLSDRDYAINILENVTFDQFELNEEDEREREFREIEDEFADTLISLYLEDNTPEAELEQLDTMLRLSYVYESKVADNIVRRSNKVKGGVRTGTNVIKTVANDVKKVTKAIDEIPQPFTNMVKNTYEKLKDLDKSKRKDALITGGFKGKLIRLIRLGFKLAFSKGLWSCLGPVYGSIAILVQYALDSKLDSKYKKEILDELEMELKLVNEKLDDAKSDNDKKAKYELMRLQDKLEKEIKRIRFSL